MRVLFVSRYLAIGGKRGNDEYVVAVLQAMAEAGFEIDYLWLGFPPTHLNWHPFPPRAAPAHRYHMPFAWRLGSWMIPRGWGLGLWIFLKRVWNFSQRCEWGRRSDLVQRIGRGLDGKLARFEVPYGRDAFPSQEDVKAFGTALESSRPQLVMANYYVMAPLFDAITDPGVGKLILTHDARHGDIAHEAELACLQKADLLLAIQEEDKEELKRNLPDGEVVLLPMPLSSSPWQRRPQPGRVLYVGSAHAVNIQGLRWFLKEVWPRVLVRMPEAVFHICGTVGEAFPESMPQVRKWGLVDDLSLEYAEAALVVVPLLIGTGLKIKLVEALQYGCPVVSTSPGLQGLAFAENRCVVRANSAEEMAEAIHQLLTNETECRRMEDQARIVIEDYFLPAVSLRPLLAWCEQRANGPDQMEKGRILRPTL